MTSIIQNHQYFLDVPKDSMIDASINVKVSNIPSNGEISIRATWISQDKVKWVSSATYKANNEGIVALADQAPLAGSYSGIDPMGLFWSMSPIPREQSLTHTNFTEQNISLEVLANAEKVAETTIVRRILSPDVERREIKDNGLVGTLFTPAGKGPFPGVAVIPGAQAGIPENHAALLASHGFVTFALGYHGFGDMPYAWCTKIDLNYFQKGFAFLREQERVNKNYLGCVGNSKGAELAVLHGSTYPEEVIPIVGYMTPSISLSTTGQSCWIKDGNEFQPHFTFYFVPQDALMQEGKIPSHSGSFDDPISTTEIMNYQMAQNSEQFRASSTKVENMKTRLLLFSGKDDQTIPSTFFSESIIERLNEYHSPIERTHISYENAGHQVCFPTLPNMPSTGLPFNLGKWFGSGGTAAGNHFAANDAFRREVEYLKPRKGE